MIDEKQYKRLTKEKITKDNVILHRNIYGNIVISQEVWDMFKKEHNQLCELEDEIENGTLIDTKVKVGQRVYMRGFWKDDFDEYIVSNIRLDNGELKISLKHDFDEGKTCYSTTIVGVDEIGKTVFLTKAEAEKKLKELQK